MKNMNKWKRTAELKQTADTIISNFGTERDAERVRLGVDGNLTMRLVNATGCTKDTAQRHIGRAIIRKFGYR